MSRVPPPVPPPLPSPPRKPLNRAQGDLSAAELAALLPPESEDDEQSPPPTPKKTGEPSAVKASVIPPPLPPGTKKSEMSGLPPPTISAGPEEPEDAVTKPKKPTGLTDQQRSLLFLLIGSFLGAVVLVVLLAVVFVPGGRSKPLEPLPPLTGVPVEETNQDIGPRRTFDVNAPEIDFIDPDQ